MNGQQTDQATSQKDDDDVDGDNDDNVNDGDVDNDDVPDLLDVLEEDDETPFINEEDGGDNDLNDLNGALT